MLFRNHTWVKNGTRLDLDKGQDLPGKKYSVSSRKSGSIEKVEGPL